MPGATRARLSDLQRRNVTPLLGELIAGVVSRSQRFVRAQPFQQLVEGGACFSLFEQGRYQPGEHLVLADPLADMDIQLDQARFVRHDHELRARGTDFSGRRSRRAQAERAKMQCRLASKGSQACALAPA